MLCVSRQIHPFLSHMWKYIIALLLLASVTAIFFMLRDALDTTLISLLYLIPLGGITAFWGLGAGILSALIAFLTFNYFFIEPYYTFTVHRPIDVVILVVFLIVAIVISQLMGRAQSGLAVAMMREREATQLYELSTALVGLHNSQTIAEVLAKQVQLVSQGDCVQISITEKQPSIYCLPDSDKPSRLPELRVPIEAAQGTLGDIQLWRSSPVISSNEKRLLRIFASQGALAFERAWLVEAESRARVLEESDKLKTALLASVSHELRTLFQRSKLQRPVCAAGKCVGIHRLARN